MCKKAVFGIALIFLFGVMLFSGFSSALAKSVCCEKTNSGLYCQDVPPEECTSSNSVQTSCKATSFCKPGTCYDSKEGTCLDNTPKLTCNLNGGVWSDNKTVAQCQMGCCVLGDQAAFVSLVRCKRLASFLGIETNYKKEIVNEAQCILSVLGTVKGACVYESDFQRNCRITTKEDCLGVVGSKNANQTKNEFFTGKLCTAEELKTICGPTTRTTCVDGKEEVYFVDTCGNPANIYDASKANDQEYWTNIKDKTESCNPNAPNANSPSCGNCNYIQGSFCRQTTKSTAKATYGENICADLNCKKTANGKSYKHGESWCVYDDKGSTNDGTSAVGSRYYKHICINGEEVLEACADFRQYECIEKSIDTPAGPFAQAACRVNRWEDCVSQRKQEDCENSDKRDCIWYGNVAKKEKNEDSGIQDVLKNLVNPEPTEPGGTTGAGNNTETILCIPKNPPGIKFWEGSTAKTACAGASVKCEALKETDIFGKSTYRGDCVDNSGDVDSKWLDSMKHICMSIGDCGPKTNWVGDSGYADSEGRVGYDVDD